VQQRRLIKRTVVLMNALLRLLKLTFGKADRLHGKLAVINSDTFIILIQK
jgi:hypothetical protein